MSRAPFPIQSFADVPDLAGMLLSTAVDITKREVRIRVVGTGLQGAILVPATPYGPRQHLLDRVSASPRQPAHQSAYLLHVERHRTFRCFFAAYPQGHERGMGQQG